MGILIFHYKRGRKVIIRHSKLVNIFSPVSSSWLVRFYAWMIGKNAELNMPSNVLARSEGREGIRINSNKSKVGREGEVQF